MAGELKKMDNQTVTDSVLYENTVQVEPVASKGRTRRVLPKKHKHRALIISLVIILIMLVIAGLQGWRYFQSKQLANQIPRSVQKSVNFGIYLPTIEEYEISTESFVYSSGVLQFVVKSSEKTIQFSQQPEAEDFDLGKFATGIGISNAEQAKVNAGNVLYGKVGNFNIAIIDTGDTTIAITSTQPETDLKPVAESMKKAL